MELLVTLAEDSPSRVRRARAELAATLEDFARRHSDFHWRIEEFVERVVGDIDITEYAAVLSAASVYAEKIGETDELTGRDITRILFRMQDATERARAVTHL